MFARWGRFVYRHRRATLVLSALALALSIAAVAQGGDLRSGGFLETREARRGLRLMQQQLPQAGGSSFVLIFESDTLRADDPRYRSAMDAALAPLKADPRVERVRTVADAPTPQIAETFTSRDGRGAIAVVNLRDAVSVAREYYAELREKIHSDVLQISATGTIAVNHDFNIHLDEDLKRAELVGLPLALILLLLVFGAVVAALLPLGVGILAVVGGLAGVFALSRFTDVAQYALNIVTLIGLGVAIDYSLFVVNRFREELKRGASVEDAIARSMATAGRAITFSGLTVAIGLMGLLFYSGTFMASMGIAGSIVVALSVIYALTLLPALLGVLGPRVDAWRLPFGGSRDSLGMWHAIATWVMRRPVLVLVPVLGAILLVGSPFLQLRLASGDISMLPARAESRRAYDHLLAEFPGQEPNRISVVTEYATPLALTPERVGELYDLTRRLAALPDVLRVDGPFSFDPRLGRAEYQALYSQQRAALPPPLQEVLRQSVGERIVVLGVATTKAVASDEARALVHAIRAEAPPPGAQLLVTGFTALDIDAIAYIGSITPVAVAFVMAATYIVLFLLLGSVLLPLKAVVMNLLSIAASFGALVWIFQWGNLSNILGFAPTSIDPTLPVILFCIVFGLSMDYEVLLLSRMQEEYLKTGDNRRAVAEGLERSGRLITGAAAIMVGVFSAFALADIVIIKAIGLGMAIAVAIDATLVRALVVPATMRLLGDLNWWAPAPLARLYRRLGLGEASAAPRAVVADASAAK